MSTCSFKIRVKIEIKEHLSVRLTLQTTEFTVYVAGCFFCRKYVSFRLYYNPQNLTFPRNLPCNVCKTRGKPTMNWFFVRLWIKFAVHRSAADPKPVKFVSELAIFPSGDQNNAKCANKQKKKKEKREKLVVFMTGYSRLVTESVSFRQGLTYWHTEFRDGFQDCSVDHMFFKCDAIS